MSGQVSTARIMRRGGATNNQVTEAPNVLMDPEEYFEFPNSHPEPMKPLG